MFTTHKCPVCQCSIPCKCQSSPSLSIHQPMSSLRMLNRYNLNPACNPCHCIGPCQCSTPSKPPQHPVVSTPGILDTSYTPIHQGLTPNYYADLSAGGLSEGQSKFIQERIAKLEGSLGNLCQGFAAVTRKTARLRDKSDEVAKSIMAFAQEERLNPSLQTSLSNFAQVFSHLQDYRNAEVLRLENKVVKPLTDYGPLCRHAKEDIKASFDAKRREVSRQQQLEKLRDRHPSDRQALSSAESELQRAKVDAIRASKNLQTQMDTFESRKITDIKAILLDFCKIELLMHGKALELYTQMYHSVANISVDDDLEDFRNTLQTGQAIHGASNVSARIDMVRANSTPTRVVISSDARRGSTSELQATANTPSNIRRPHAQNRPPSRVSQKSYIEEDEGDTDDGGY